jgi:hypothetical protein
MNPFTTIDFVSEKSGPNPPAVGVESDEIYVKEVIRRLSSVSVSEFDDLNESDLRKDYQTAIDCLIQCESIIKNLQEHLLSKEERIVCLEDKIMHMSLDLASSMAHGDHLQHKLNSSFTSASSTKATNVISYTSTASSEMGLTSPLIDDSNSSRFSKNLGQLLFGVKNEIGIRNDPKLVEEGQANFSKNPNDISEKTASAVEARRMSKLGLFARNNCSRKERRLSGMQLEFAESQDVKVVEEEEDEKGHRNDMNFDGPRRRLARTRYERQPSARSFLEATGVIFPSTSLDVLAKGCLTTSTKKVGECNMGWGEFR